MREAKHVINVSHNFSFIVQLHYEILIKSAGVLIHNDVISLSLKALWYFYFCTPRGATQTVKFVAEDIHTFCKEKSLSVSLHLRAGANAAKHL